MKTGQSYLDAKATLEHSGVIAYPTEAVFGLGCNPLDEAATHKVLSLKSRVPEKGLILISYDWESFMPWADDLPIDALQEAESKTPHPVTWLVRKSSLVPSWVHGEHDKVAIRVVQHADAKAICQAFGGPIVSTSCNPEGLPPARSVEEAQAFFGEEIEYYFSSPVGPFKNPSEIRDSVTHESLRVGGNA